MASKQVGVTDFGFLITFGFGFGFGVDIDTQWNTSCFVLYTCIARCVTLWNFYLRMH